MKNLAELVSGIASLSPDERTRDTLKQIKRAYAKNNGLSRIPTNIQILREYHHMIQSGGVDKDVAIEELLKKRPVRSQSGIVSVQVLTKPFRCPGKCIFCPNDFTMPKSYINTEPGAMRALLNGFDPAKQVYNRLLSLTLTGHQTDKIEMIVLGGTWDVYPDEYKESFLKGLYDACNSFPSFFKQIDTEQLKDEKNLTYNVDEMTFDYPQTIEESIQINETAKQKVIGLTVETRPEYVTHENCQMRRKWGVTRLEMGVQSTNDAVLDANKRGHGMKEVRAALHLLRQYAFKFSIHLMPGLYKSDEEKDLQTFIDTYQDKYLRPDEIKFYPTSVIPNTELYELRRSGEYKSMDVEAIKRIVRYSFDEVIPPYTRIKRLIRDIPSTEIAAGSDVTNLSQLVRAEIRKDMAEDPAHRTKLYNRLYTQDTRFATPVDYLSSLSGQVVGDQDIVTALIGDVEVDKNSVRRFVALDTRSREIRQRHQVSDRKSAETQEREPEKVLMVVRTYRSSVGLEYFIAFEDELGYLYGFTRLLLPDEDQTVDFPGLGKSTAMIRELHVYGKVAKIGGESQHENKFQHRGFGRQLMEMAEQISQTQGYQKLTVIAGVGVKEYYRKVLGYQNDGTYVSKKITKEE